MFVCLLSFPCLCSPSSPDRLGQHGGIRLLAVQAPPVDDDGELLRGVGVYYDYYYYYYYYYDYYCNHNPNTNIASNDTDNYHYHCCPPWGWAA